MKTSFSVMAALLVSTNCAAQEAPKLGPPVPVDIRVDEVHWHPKGAALAYARKMDSGVGIGTFVPGQQEGKVLLEIGAEDHHEMQWYDHAPRAIVIVRKKIQFENTTQTNLLVYDLDAKNKVVRKLFDRGYAAGIAVDCNVDLSPLLFHGIFRVTTTVSKDGKQASITKHFVLPAGGQQLIPAPDIDLAVSQGRSGPVWAFDGTGTYGEYSTMSQHYFANEVRSLLLTEARQYVEQVAGTYEVRARIERKGDSSGEDSFLKLWVRSALPPPPVGTAVLQVIPSSGRIIPVKFKGAFEEKHVDVPPLVNELVPNQVSYGVSKANTSGLWLFEQAEDEKANQKLSSLIAADADSAWLSPTVTGLVYRSFGALFYRSIESPKRKPKE